MKIAFKTSLNGRLKPLLPTKQGECESGKGGDKKLLRWGTVSAWP